MRSNGHHHPNREKGRSGPDLKKTRRNHNPTRNGQQVKALGSMRRQNRRFTGRQIFVRAGVTLVSVLLIFILSVALLWNYIFSGLRPSPHGGDLSLLPETLTHQPPSIKEITNILLLGVDTYDDTQDDAGRSDSIIILTINRKDNTVKMTSIMRDCYVYIPGFTRPNKLNAAYSFGGPELAMRTISNTLRLKIDKYAIVNMDNMMALIDIAGGIMIDVDTNEMRDMNKRLWAQSLSESGYQKLNGYQAVQYARIRKIDSDWARTGRQREVLLAIFRSFREIHAIQKAQMLQKGISYVHTNLTASEITFLALDVLPKISTDVQEMRLPLEGYYKVNSAGSWFMVVDYNRMIPEIYKFLYGEEHPFDPVPTISYKPVTATPWVNSYPSESHDPEGQDDPSFPDESEDSSEVSSDPGHSESPESTPTPTGSNSSDSQATSFDPWLTPTLYATPTGFPWVTFPVTPTPEMTVTPAISQIPSPSVTNTPTPAPTQPTDPAPSS